MKEYKNMMRKFILILSFFWILPLFAQEIKKENLTKKVSFYYDKNKVKLQSQGAYFKDELGETTEKHGRWKYYDQKGKLEEEREYYRDLLNGRVLAFHPNEKPRQEGYFVNNRQDSLFREWYENGKLKVEGWYKSDKPVGKWNYYYSDGRLKSVEEMDGGVLLVNEFYLPDSAHTQLIKDGNGELLIYYNTGSLKEFYQYKDGLKHGEFEEYSIYNYPLLTGSFSEGKKSGTWKYYYYTGDLEKEIDYENDLMNGPYRLLYDTGKTKVSGAHKENLKEGHWIWYTNKGTIDMEGDFKDDLQHGAWTYNYPTGELSYKAQYDLGKKTGFWKYYYKDGKDFKQGAYQNDQKQGVWKTWYESGQLLMEGSYENGKENGLWVNYWENGTIKNRSGFKNGVLNGIWESYHQDGKLSLKGEYENNFKSGEWITYFENGMPAELETYKVFEVESKINYSILKDFDRTESYLHGTFIRYSQKDFQISEKGSYSKNEKDGEWIAYHARGKMPAVITNYKKGVLNGWMKQYDKAGILVSEAEYKNGLRDGKFRMYDRDGKMVKEKIYDKGVEVIEGTRSGTGFSTGK
jgi:uncharacterized protein